MMSLVIEASYWRAGEKELLLKMNQNVSKNHQAEWPSVGNLWHQSQSFVSVTIIYSQSLFSGTFESKPLCFCRENSNKQSSRERERALHPSILKRCKRKDVSSETIDTGGARAFLPNGNIDKRAQLAQLFCFCFHVSIGCHHLRCFYSLNTSTWPSSNQGLFCGCGFQKRRIKVWLRSQLSVCVHTHLVNLF